MGVSLLKGADAEGSIGDAWLNGIRSEPLESRRGRPWNALGNIWRRTKRITPAKLLGHIKILFRRFTLGDVEELRIYKLDRSEISRQSGLSEFQLNSTDHLFKYAESPDLPQDREHYIAEALKRLESGQRMYTVEQNGKLAHFSWINVFPLKLNSGLGSVVVLPEGSLIFHNEYTYPWARGRGLQRRGHLRKLSDVLDIDGAQHVFIAVYASNGRSRRNIERTGFKLFARCTRKRWWWRTISRVEYEPDSTSVGGES